MSRIRIPLRPWFERAANRRKNERNQHEVHPDDEHQILALYELLKRMSDNPVVVLNHAVAPAMVHGPRKGLELLNTLDSDPRMADHHRLDAVRAHLLELAGDAQGALRHYRAAAAKTTNLAERDYLAVQAARLAGE